MMTIWADNENMKLQRLILGGGLAVLGLGATAQTDVSRTRITDKPASGMIRGKAFFVKASKLRIAGSNSIQFKTLPEDRTRTFELTFYDDKWIDSKRHVGVRIIVDDKTLLDGKTVLWRPLKGDSPENFAQVYPGGTSVGRLSRGVSRVTVYWLPGSHGTYQSEAFRDRFSVRLEFGKREGGFLPGKVAISLPDASKSYLIGSFRAELEGRA